MRLGNKKEALYVVMEKYCNVKGQGYPVDIGSDVYSPYEINTHTTLGVNP
jgi:hypothetical protein